MEKDAGAKEKRLRRLLNQRTRSWTTTRSRTSKHLRKPQYRKTSRKTGKGLRSWHQPQAG